MHVCNKMTTTGAEFKLFGEQVAQHFYRMRTAHEEQDAHNELKAEVERAKTELKQQMDALAHLTDGVS